MSTDSRPIPREFLLWVWIISYWNFNCTYEQLKWQELSLNEIRKLFGRRISAIKNLTNNSSSIYKKRIRVTIDNWSRNKILKYVEREINILTKKTSVPFIFVYFLVVRSKTANGLWIGVWENYIPVILIRESIWADFIDYLAKYLDPSIRFTSNFGYCRWTSSLSES